MGICAQDSSAVEVLVTDGDYRLLRTPEGHLLEENVLYFESAIELEEEENRLARRMQLRTNVPKVRHYHSQSTKCSVASHELKLSVEKTALRLSQVAELQQGDAWLLLTNLLEVSAYLQDHYNYQFSQDKAGFTQEGGVILWVNDNYFKNQPSDCSFLNHRKDNRDKITQAVLAKCNSPSLKQLAAALPQRVRAVAGAVNMQQLKQVRAERPKSALTERRQVSVQRLQKQVSIQQNRLETSCNASCVSTTTHN